MFIIKYCLNSTNSRYTPIWETCFDGLAPLKLGTHKIRKNDFYCTWYINCSTFIKSPRFILNHLYFLCFIHLWPHKVSQSTINLLEMSSVLQTKYVAHFPVWEIKLFIQIRLTGNYFYEKTINNIHSQFFCPVEIQMQWYLLFTFTFLFCVHVVFILGALPVLYS